MLDLKHFMLTLFVILLFASYYEVSGYAINSRGSKQQLQLTSSLIGPSTTENPETKTEQPTTTTHHVPLDNASSKATSHILGKREVSQIIDGDEARVNGLYDPDLMIMSKRSAAALNNLMLALRPRLRPFDASNSYENEQSALSKDTTRFVRLGARTPGSGSSEAYPSYSSMVRRNPKNKYYKCYFNAVSCF